MTKLFKTGVTAEGDIATTGFLKSTNSSGDEGGQIDLTKAATNTTLTTGVTIDVFQNKVRIFETGGTNRGYYLDITGGATSAGSNLAGSGSYTLPTASSTVLGGVELFSDTAQTVAANTVTATTARTYGAQLNASNQLVINVPWTDTVYSLPTATSTVLGGIELYSDTTQSVAAAAVTATASRTYGIQTNSSGQAVVNVPWTDTTTFISSTLMTTLGDIIYGGASGAATRLAAPTTNGTYVLTSVPSASVGVAPTWSLTATANTANSIVLRDGSGNFSAGAITGTSFNSITGLSSTTPSGNGTAAVGTATTAARADHVHPLALPYIGSTQATSSSNGTNDIAGINSITSVNTAALTISSGSDGLYLGYSGLVTLKSGDANGVASGGMSITTGNVTTSGSSGSITLKSGNSLAGSGSVTVTTGTSSDGLNTTTGSLTLGTGAGAGSQNNSGSITIQTGAGSGSSGGSGSVTIDSGLQSGGGTAGSISIGTTRASALTIGRSGVVTTINGTLGTLTHSGSTTLRAGTSTAGTAPLYMQSGTNLTAAAAGAIEYDGTVFYKTSSTAPGRALDVQNYYYLSNTAYAIVMDTAAFPYSILGATNRGITVSAGTTYDYECMFALTATFIVTSQTPTITITDTTVTGSPVVAHQTIFETGNNTAGFATAITLGATRITAGQALTALTASQRFYIVKMRGTIRVTGTGTAKIFPSIRPNTGSPDNGWSFAAGTMFKLTPIGNGTVETVGTWA